MEKETFFDKPFEAMKPEELKAAIKNKFGNIARFCRLTGRDVYTFNKLFRLKRTQANMSQLHAIYISAKNTPDRPADNELGAGLRKRIKAAIFAQHNNILAFCKKEGFSNSWVSTVLNGGVHKVTPKVYELLDALNIKAEEAQQTEAA